MKEFDMNQQWCQSCGMPMGYTDEYLGTNADGSKNPDYCSHCWKDGQFTSPELTMEQMVELCVPYMAQDSELDITEASARQLMQETLPKLKRWKK